MVYLLIYIIKVGYLFFFVFICKWSIKIKSIILIFFILSRIYVLAETDYRIGGRLFIDGGFFINSDHRFNSGVNIPDLRLTGKVYFNNGWYTKLDFGFASNKVKLKDAFIQKIKGEHMFRIGYMIGMFSLDQSSSTNDYLFMTGANVAETFYPDRRIGVSYTYSDKRLYFSSAFFCGDGLNFRSNIKPGVNVTTRLVYRPMNDMYRLLHIGIGGLYKVPDINIDTGDSYISLISKGATYLSVPYVFEEVINKTKDQFQLNLEGIIYLRRIFIQGEIMGMKIRREALRDFNAYGGYMEGGFFITGKRLGYDERDALPICTYDSGALAVFARLGYTNLNSYDIKCGSLFDISLGMNYYINENIIVRFNYSNIRTDEFSSINDSGFNIIQSRLQIKF